MKFELSDPRGVASYSANGGYFLIVTPKPGPITQQKIEEWSMMNYIPTPAGKPVFFLGPPTVLPENAIGPTSTCRESFQVHWERVKFHKFIGFKAPKLDIGLMKDFWNRIAQKIGDQANLTFYETNVPETVVIEVPEFWRLHCYRQTIFSMLLRCSACFYGRDYATYVPKKELLDVVPALKSYSLAVQVLPTLEHFLAGNIHPVNPRWTRPNQYGGTGLVIEFSGLPQADIESRLSKNEIVFTPEQLAPPPPRPAGQPVPTQPVAVGQVLFTATQTAQTQPDRNETRTNRPV